MAYPWYVPKMKEIWKVFQKLSYEQDSVVGSGGGVWTDTKNTVTPDIPGWLNYIHYKVWDENT